MRPFKRIREVAPIHAIGCGFASVKVLRLWREHGVCAGLLGHGSVRLQRPRVGLKILSVIELGGVDQNRHHDKLPELCRMPNQTQVALVQSTHCGDEAGLFVPPIGVLLPFSQRVQRMQNRHENQWFWV